MSHFRCSERHLTHSYDGDDGGSDELSQRDILTLVLSGLALIISLYGIYERRQTLDRSYRIRLTELVDDLAQIGVAEQQAISGKAANELQSLISAMASRRALLIAQIVDLLARYRGKVTIPEYLNVATALHQINDVATEGQVLREAITQRKAAAFYRWAAWRAWGWYCFSAGDAERGRLAYQTSLNVRQAVDSATKIDMVDTLLWWFDCEIKVEPGAIDRLTSMLDQATKLTDGLDDAERDLLSISDRLQDAKRRLSGDAGVERSPQ